MLGPAVFRSPRQVLYGRGSIAGIGALAKTFGSNALICTDSGVASTPIVQRVARLLREEGVASTVVESTASELPPAALEEAAVSARRDRPDFIIGLGGGSSIDLAKVTSLLSSFPAPVESYFGENQVPAPGLPVLAVPTTAGTGSEVSPVAVVQDPRRKGKVGISSPHLVPVACVCDPGLTDGCPMEVSTYAGIDALGHALEAYTAKRRVDSWSASDAPSRVFIGKNVVSDCFALEAIKYIGRALPKVVHDGGDRSARDEMLYGSLMAGYAFSTAGTSLAHALQYPLGSLTGTPHGLGIGLLLPYALDFNRPVRTEELAAIAEMHGLVARGSEARVAARATVQWVSDLTKAIGLPPSLQSLGVSESQLDAIAIEASTVRRLIENNPRTLDRDSLYAVLHSAWLGDLDFRSNDPELGPCEQELGW